MVAAPNGIPTRINESVELPSRNVHMGSLNSISCSYWFFNISFSIDLKTLLTQSQLRIRIGHWLDMMRNAHKCYMQVSWRIMLSKEYRLPLNERCYRPPTHQKRIESMDLAMDL